MKPFKAIKVASSMLTFLQRVKSRKLSGFIEINQDKSELIPKIK